MSVLYASAVLFDLDGTLVDSTSAVEQHWAEFARWYDLDINEIVAHSHGRAHLATIATHLEGASDRDLKIAIKRFEDLEVDDAGGETAMPGALELLESLPDGSYTIVTACWRELAEARANAAGIVLPSTVVTSDQVRKAKPAPDGYLLAAVRLGATPEQCVVFEDSVSGVLAANAANAQLVTLMTTTPVDHLTKALDGSGRLVKDLTSVQVIDTYPDLSFELDTIECLPNPAKLGS